MITNRHCTNACTFLLGSFFVVVFVLALTYRRSFHNHLIVKSSMILLSDSKSAVNFKKILCFSCVCIIAWHLRDADDHYESFESFRVGRMYHTVQYLLEKQIKCVRLRFLNDNTPPMRTL